MDLIIYAALGPEGTERRLARRLLALALERELGLPVLPEMALEAGGKPCFPDRPDICFNLSHSHGAAVCALHQRGAPADSSEEAGRRHDRRSLFPPVDGQGSHNQAAGPWPGGSPEAPGA